MSKKSLVLYYSWSGNTRKIAELIARKTGADLRELQLENAYPQNYDNVLTQAKREIQGKWYPTLRPIDMDWSAYETVYLGAPNWWSTMAPPVASFLNQVMPTEKGIAPFCTHGGGSAGHIAEVLRNSVSAAMRLPLLVVQEDGGTSAERLVDQWLKQIGE